jgi:hypothetical protein
MRSAKWRRRNILDVRVTFTIGVLVEDRVELEAEPE